MNSGGKNEHSRDSTPQIPLLQTTHWIATSSAAIITSLVVLLQLVTWIDSTLFQVVLVALSIGILVALTTRRSDKTTIRTDWLKAVEYLATSRLQVETLFVKTIKGRIEFDSNIMLAHRLNVLSDAILQKRTFARAVYRLALIQNEQELATDILVDINDYTEWLVKIEDVFKTIKVG